MFVLVTGGTGVIGRQVVRRLIAEGHTVRVLSRQPLRGLELKKLGARMVGGDITQPHTLAHALGEAEVVVHAAGLVGFGNPWQSFTLANVTGVANMLAAARASGVRRFVHVSSIAAYARPHGPTSEDAPIGPGGRRGGYGASKARGDALARAAGDAGGLEVTIVRPAVVYDDGRAPTDARYWVRRARRVPLLPLPAGGDFPFEIVHAADVAQLVALCVTVPAAAGQAYNATSDEAPRLRDLVRGAGGGPAILALPGRRRDATFPATRAREQLGYVPAHRWAEEDEPSPAPHAAGSVRP